MAGQDLQVQVLMVGGRRCGKTSVLAAMKANFEEVFSKTSMNIIIDDVETLETLNQKNMEINDYFYNVKKRTFIPDSNPTEEMTTYSLVIGLAGKKSRIKVKFVDFPGEWLTEKSHSEEIVNCMKDSQAVIVAIDTPHLMEEDGRFNEHRNSCYKINEMLKMALEKENTAHNKRLFLFVPLKCERYLKDNKMEEVYYRTCEAYKRLFDFLKKTPNKYEVAIAPIFTLGCAMFSHFERDEDTQEVRIDNKFHTPEKAVYFFPDTSVKKPAPKYCEQPIVYLLGYILQMAGEQKKNNFSNSSFGGKFMIKMKEWILHSASANDYLQHKEEIIKRIKKDGEGYHIVQNPMKF